jgi:hypothetical protein
VSLRRFLRIAETFAGAEQFFAPAIIGARKE